MKIIRKKILNWLGMKEYRHLQRVMFELDNVTELRKYFGWNEKPILNDDDIYKFEHEEDFNERRIRDAEAIATVIRNTNPSVCLDIGTADGNSAALMAENALQSQVYTVNIPPEEVLSGEGGVYTTIAMERERIGSYYRSKGYKNITQILENTAKWEPNIGVIDVAFVDGCHDTEFVYNDTKKVLANSKSGTFIMWHDFNPELQQKFPWIYDVCKGVELLLEEGLIQGNIYHVKNSWVGIYRVP